MTSHLTGEPVNHLKNESENRHKSMKESNPIRQEQQVQRQQPPPQTMPMRSGQPPIPLSMSSTEQQYQQKNQQRQTALMEASAAPESSGFLTVPSAWPANQQPPNRLPSPSPSPPGETNPFIMAPTPTSFIAAPETTTQSTQQPIRIDMLTATTREQQQINQNQSKPPIKSGRGRGRPRKNHNSSSNIDDEKRQRRNSSGNTSSEGNRHGRCRSSGSEAHSNVDASKEYSDKASSVGDYSRRSRSPTPVSSSFTSTKKSQQTCNNINMINNSKHRKVTIQDSKPDRIVNPLLDLPRFPHNARNLDPDSVPNGAELYKWADLYLCQPDTFPLSYYARILGFDVPPSAANIKEPFIKLDPQTLPLRKDHVWTVIPKEGNFASQIWNNGTARKNKETSTKIESSVPNNHDNCNEDEKLLLDYIDPMYKSILKQGYDVTKLTPSTSVSVATAHISTSCIACAKELNVLAEGWTFAFATTSDDDVNILKQLSSAGHCSSATTAGVNSITGAPARVGEFVIIAKYQSKPMGCIHYQFQWYRFDDDDDRGPADDDISNELPKPVEVSATNDDTTAAAPAVAGAYGMASGASKIYSKPKVSELLFCINHIECAEVRNAENKVMEQRATDEIRQSTKNSDSSSTSVSMSLENPASLVLTALALEHARSCNIWYGMLKAPYNSVSWFTKFFRMIILPNPVEKHCRNRESISQKENDLAIFPGSNDSHTDFIDLVCDLKKCSYKYAFLKKRESNDTSSRKAVSNSDKSSSLPSTSVCERMLVRFPTEKEAKAIIDEEAIGENDGIEQQRGPSTKTNNTNSRYMVFTGPSAEKRDIKVGVRATLPTPDSPPLSLHRICNNGKQGEKIPAANFTRNPTWDVLRVFPKLHVRNGRNPCVCNESEREKDEVLRELCNMQAEMSIVGKMVEPKVRNILMKIMKERMDWEGEKSVSERQRQKKILKDYEAVLERRREMDRAWQKQLEQDMDAVCAICNDGEVTPDNQILFCEACNVAIHQYCYGITRVPEGDYYCLACRYFDRGNMANVAARQLQRGVTMPKMAASPLPIFCELCPQKQGAFIRTDTSGHKGEGEKTALTKWVHVVCAKWQGLNFVDLEKKDLIEDVSLLKTNFRHLHPRPRCLLCQGNRGAFNECGHPGCGKWLHVTCARSSGMCSVVHGEDCVGPVDENPWTLFCPEHSDIEVLPEGSVSIEQLVRAAKEFPPEPEIPAPRARPPKFQRMTGRERRKYLADRDYENDFFRVIMTEKLQGVRCEVCNQCEDDGTNLTRCVDCGVVFCDSCTIEPDGVVKGKDYVCRFCKYVEKKGKGNGHFEPPQCHLCYQKGGWLRKSFANPVNRKAYWKNNPKEFEKSWFSKDLWSHAFCTMWQTPRLVVDQITGEVDCSNIIMSHGKHHIFGKTKCDLCGQAGGLKNQCKDESCRAWGQLRTPYNFHATCARQAGLEVKDEPDGSGYYSFYINCHRHGDCAFTFRAKLEDLIEIEKKRAGKRLTSVDAIMSLAHASRLFNAALVVMQSLGWAWRWAEWWVEFGQNWEPFLEPGEVESKMTKKQLRIVDSTRESRCADARRCRLAAVGAALRNREYDKKEGDDTVALDKALRAILHTQSLVGPLEQYEIDFFAEWLGRAYRSKSRMLGYGNDKIPVANNGRCVHIEDGSAKYELGNRSLPGKQSLLEGEFFERGTCEVDDFLKEEKMEDGTVITEQLLAEKGRGVRKKRTPSKSKSPRKKKKRMKQMAVYDGDDGGDDDDDDDDGGDDDFLPISTVVRKQKSPGGLKKEERRDNGASGSPSKKQRGWPKGKPRGKRSPEKMSLRTEDGEEIEENEASREIDKQRERPTPRKKAMLVEVAPESSESVYSGTEGTESVMRIKYPTRSRDGEKGRKRLVNKREDCTPSAAVFDEEDAEPLSSLMKKMKKGMTYDEGDASGSIAEGCQGEETIRQEQGRQNLSRHNKMVQKSNEKEEEDGGTGKGSSGTKDQKDNASSPAVKIATAQMAPLFTGDHDDNCFICDNGGELICCDFCEKAFHLPCHLPPLDSVPSGLWKCCECCASERKRKTRCGSCDACKREDCGSCKSCLDKPKFGGMNSLKQPCVLRKCQYMNFVGTVPVVVPAKLATTNSLSTPLANKR